MANIQITRENIMDNIEALEKLGFKRWQKNGMDRMYISADKLGYDNETRTFKDERISGGLAGQLSVAKTYIDLKEYIIVSTACDLTYEVATMIGVDPIGGRCKMEIA